MILKKNKNSRPNHGCTAGCLKLWSQMDSKTDKFHLAQMVNAPTRENNILDLVFTNNKSAKTQLLTKLKNVRTTSFLWLCVLKTIIFDLSCLFCVLMCCFKFMFSNCCFWWNIKCRELSETYLAEIPARSALYTSPKRHV